MVALLLGILQPVQGAEWTVPAVGNGFRTAPDPGGRGGRGEGAISWRGEDEVYSIYFRVDRPASLKLSIQGNSPDGEAKLNARVGTHTFPFQIDGADSQKVELGSVEISEIGYVQVTLQGVGKQGQTFGRIENLIIDSDTDGLTVDFVRNNDGNMFYWGRRGPSVHLTYVVPRDKDITYGYSELTVPQGQDVIGSYFMANGFAEGYFGIQANSPNERRVLFSVWSPFQTDNPRNIPEDQRIERLASGPGVRIGEFGNEGSGGQSILVYPWKADTTYRFLTEVKPDGDSHTIYTSWFSEKSEEWRLIASFRRPKTSTHFKRFHSFLENFNERYGHVTRGARYGNVWVCDVDGNWFECIEARLSADATARGRHRLDYNGGTEGNSFFMQNCGFFKEIGAVGEVFRRESTAGDQPKIDFDKLPRK